MTPLRKTLLLSAVTLLALCIAGMIKNQVKFSSVSQSRHLPAIREV